MTGFREKPSRDAGYINGGFFVVDRKIKDYLTGDDCILEREPMVGLANEGKIKAFCHAGFWQCMDTYREQQLLTGMWNSGTAPWKIW